MFTYETTAAQRGYGATLQTMARSESYNRGISNMANGAAGGSTAQVGGSATEYYTASGAATDGSSSMTERATISAQRTPYGLTVNEAHQINYAPNTGANYSTNYHDVYTLVPDDFTYYGSSSETYAYGAGNTSTVYTETIRKTVGTHATSGTGTATVSFPTTTTSTATHTVEGWSAIDIESTFYGTQVNTVAGVDIESATVIMAMPGERLFTIASIASNVSAPFTSLYELCSDAVTVQNNTSSRVRAFAQVAGDNAETYTIPAASPPLTYNVFSTAGTLTGTRISDKNFWPLKTSSFTYYDVALDTSTIPHPEQQVGYGSSAETGVLIVTSTESSRAMVTSTATCLTLIQSVSGLYVTTVADSTVRVPFTYTTTVFPDYLVTATGNTTYSDGFSRSTYAQGMTITQIYSIHTSAVSLNGGITALAPYYAEGVKHPLSMERTSAAKTNVLSIAGTSRIYYPFYSSVQPGVIVPVPYSRTSYTDASFSYTAKWTSFNTVYITKKNSLSSTSTYSGSVGVAGTARTGYAADGDASLIGGFQSINASEIALFPVNAFEVTENGTADGYTMFTDYSSTVQGQSTLKVFKPVLAVRAETYASYAGYLDDGNFSTFRKYRTDGLDLL